MNHNGFEGGGVKNTKEEYGFLSCTQQSSSGRNAGSSGRDNPSGRDKGRLGEKKGSLDRAVREII